MRKHILAGDSLTFKYQSISTGTSQWWLVTIPLSRKFRFRFVFRVASWRKLCLFSDLIWSNFIIKGSVSMNKQSSTARVGVVKNGPKLLSYFIGCLFFWWVFWFSWVAQICISLFKMCLIFGTASRLSTTGFYLKPQKIAGLANWNRPTDSDLKHKRLTGLVNSWCRFHSISVRHLTVVKANTFQ